MIFFVYVSFLFVRARSVYERALIVEFHNIGLWAKYIAMETKNKFVNSVGLPITEQICAIDVYFWFVGPKFVRQGNSTAAPC